MAGEQPLSTAQNTQWAKAFAAGARYATPGGDDADGFVRFDESAWKAWDTAIGTFIGELNKAKDMFDGYGRWGHTDHGALEGAKLQSVRDTKELLREKMPQEAKDSIANYVEYLKELRKGIETAYKRLNNIDLA
jgi:hypothetical protein